MNILEAMTRSRVETRRQRGERFARDRRERRRAELRGEIEPYRPPVRPPDDLPF